MMSGVSTVFNFKQDLHCLSEIPYTHIALSSQALTCLSKHRDALVSFFTWMFFTYIMKARSFICLFQV